MQHVSITILLTAALPLAAATESTIFSFGRQPGPADACGDLHFKPGAGLLLLNNRLYGTAPTGGAGESGVPGSRDGTVFSLTIPQPGETAIQKVLHNFTGNAGDGAYPCGRLIAGPHSVLYGTTFSGRANNLGTVFSLSHEAGESSWSEKILYSFQGGTDGASPAGGLAIDAAGNLYGATSSGGIINNGTVFMLSPPATGQGEWTETVLYRFGGGSDGSVPGGDLLLDNSTGALFGTTQGGGVSPLNDDCCGVVFFLWQEIQGSPQYTFKVLHQFTNGADGATPLANLFEDTSRAFWGTTMAGSANSLGTVFKLAPDRKPLTTDGTGALYGTTGAGGSAGAGTVFKLTP
ncbi:MAG TPA: choice-of-anchor tandem repeat GloVer-containing protein [Bryobacteraceae bacterium]|nr:choice-of-anchor tandem repeat GloVer-containing protein [Bryobacteraceae bacterium]